MRMVIIGGGGLAAHCAAALAARDHEVVIIEKDQDQIDLLSQEIDCGFILGDGAKPKFLEEASPDNTDALICLSDSDTDNLLAAQVAATLGFDKVIVRVEDDELEPVCQNLKLENIIFTNRLIANEFINLSESKDGMHMSARLDGELQFVELTLEDNSPAALTDIDLPEQCNLVTVKNDDGNCLPAEVDSLKAGDKLLFVIAHENLSELRQCLGLDTEE